jgi:DUF4097 and DUF4098 domain-containing protein YvlB
MPTFDTAGPISVTISLQVGDVQVSAGDRTDAVVEVRPDNPTNKSDLRVVEQTRIEYADGRLLIKTPKNLGYWFGRTGSIDVEVKVPSGSDLRADTGLGDVVVDGQVGECYLKTGYGEIRAERTGALMVNTGGGDVTVEHAEGDAMVTTGTGAVRVRHITGSAMVKNSNGDTWIGAVDRDLHATAANGGITVDRAEASVAAKTAHGSVRVGEVVRGQVMLQTASGDLEVGIRQGTAAWLDVNTYLGQVRNQLSAATGPDEDGDTVEVRARTYHGDIIIRRS